MTANPTTLVELLRQRAADQPEQDGYIFLIDGEKEGPHLTYGELDRQARAIGGLLQSHKAHGERILLLYPPGLAYIAAFFGCLYAGAIPVPAYPPANKRHIPRIQGIIEDAQTALVLTIEKTQSKIQNWLLQSSARDPLHLLTTDNMMHREAKGWKQPEIKSDDLAFLQYTSGSTSKPKGVMLTHRNLLYNLEMIYKYFNHAPESKGVIWLPPYHDMGLIGGILQPLFGAFPVVLMSPVAFLQRPIRWMKAISQYQATTSGGPNFAYDLCVQKIPSEQRENLDLSSWKLAFSGAEPIHKETLKNFVATFKACGFRYQAFYPCYGLAEATLLVSGGQNAHTDLPVIRSFDGISLEYDRVIEVPENVPKSRTLVGCGYTPDAQELIIVNPKFLTRSLSGQVGEIWVSGPGVAQGYWNQPDATQESFQANPLVSRNKRFLRTGDLGFVRNNELFITGRLKDLIIIRGRNHYPEDIEWHVEQSYPAFREDGCAAFSINIDDEEQLVIVVEIERRYQRKLAKQKQRRLDSPEQTYTLGFSQDIKQPPDFSQAIATIRQTAAKLHDLQAYTVLLLKYGTMPRTSSGKIQRHACREKFLEATLDVLAEWSSDRQLHMASTPYKMPRSKLEETVATLCSEVFGIDRVGMQDNFFELGGDSLKMTQFISRLRDTFAIELPLSDIFEIDTVANLVAKIEMTLSKKEGSEFLEMTHRTETWSIPLSFGQQRLWFFDQLEPGNNVYNLPSHVRLQGPLNAAVLRQSLQEIVNRHTILRTSFAIEDGQPVQQIAPSVTVSLPRTDIQSIPEAEKTREVQRLTVQEFQKPFDLFSSPPLFRMKLLKLSEEEHILLITAHHILVDEWSYGVFLSEFVTLYKAFAVGQPSPFAPLALQYTDFARWQHEWMQSAEPKRHVDYWKKKLSGVRAILELPTDHPRPPKQTFQGKTYSFVLPQELCDALKILAYQQGVTLFMILLAAFKTFLSRYTHQEDISVGSPIANRQRTELEQMIGFFINTLVLRTDMSGNPSFIEVLERVRQVALEGYDHQALPFEQIVNELKPERKLSHSPLFQVMFMLQNAPLGSLELPDLTLTPYENEGVASLFDLTLIMEGREETLHGKFEYSTDLFEDTTIVRMAKNFETLLQAIVTNPDQRVGSIPLVSPREHYQLFAEWNSTEAQYPREFTVTQLFEQQVEQTPDACAITYVSDRGEEHSLTYRQLNQKANRLAYYLQEIGITPETLVGIYIDRSLEMLIGLLAVLKAGGTYVPLDPDFPKERIEFMIQDTRMPVILTQDHLRDTLPEHRATVICLDRDWPGNAGIPTGNPGNASIPAGREGRLEAGVPRDQNLPCQVRGDNLAYIIFTSGSTGRPKGVQIPHQAFVNFLCSMKQKPGLQSSDTLLAVTTLSFDIAGLELFLPLIVGARIVLIDREEAADGEALLQRLRASGATMMQATPVSWQLMLAAGWEKGPKFQILCGGEPLPYNLAEQLLARSDAVWNMYGPTETTIWSTLEQVERIEEKGITIGHPIANTQMYILDDHFNPAPVGVSGELYIGGDGVVRGYFNRPDLTAERFIPDRFSAKPGARLYRTGDLARYRSDGRIEFFGRIDFQVKVRGYRIELGEIETVLSQHPDVQKAVVVVREDVPGDKRLVGYIVQSFPLLSEEGSSSLLPERERQFPSWEGQGVGKNGLEQHETSQPTPNPSQEGNLAASQRKNLLLKAPGKGARIQDYLKQKLPAYMIPSNFVFLADFPLTPNGKVDRKALPASFSQGTIEGKDFVAPRTSTEETLATAWSDILKVQRVGIHDNFFESGGHSLLATQIMTRVRKTFEIDLPLRYLFEEPTIAGMADRIDTILWASRKPSTSPAAMENERETGLL